MTRTRGARRLGACLAIAASALTAPTAGASQQRPAPPGMADEAPPPSLDVSPRGAFLRALLVPGWGHVAIGADTRGGAYFAVQSATTLSLLRARLRVGEVQDRVRTRERVLRTRLAAEGVTDPAEVEEAFDADPQLGDLRGLLGSRKEQQEDLVAFGLFVLFLSGADAYVSAHLARFPDPLEVGASPTPDGGFEVAVRLTLPR